MKRYRIRIKETIATIICEEPFIEAGVREIIRQRRFLEVYLGQHPDFGSSMVPVCIKPGAPPIVREMARRSSLFGAGPMSAVAGAIAQYALAAMLRAGAGHVVVDNGGDIAMKISEPVTVGVFAGPARVRDIGIRFNPSDAIIGVCTSSGTVGHSFSFGCADAATVIACDAITADAAATVLGNDIVDHRRNTIRDVLKRHLNRNITALMVIAGDVLAFCGEMPRLVFSKSPVERISV